MTTIGRYEVLGEIGRGGMGVVYRARDPVIDRDIALKTMRNAEGLAPAVYQQMRERFLREARAAGRLAHPHIVTVLDAGTDEASGVSFIAMEFVGGGDLEHELRAGRRFTAQEAAEVVANVADALDHAHGLGIVHRDIKPANLLRDAAGRVKVTDFGIARVAESGMTQSGQVLGSPAYMSPEQISGAPVDGRSDVFSLGVVLYELLVGERPFLGESLTTLTYQVVHREAIPPSAVNPVLPRTLDVIVAQALAKRPEDRFARARDLAAALRAAVAGGTTARTGTVLDAPVRSGTLLDVAPTPATPTLTLGPRAATTAQPQVPPEAQRPAPRSRLRPALLALGAAIGLAGGVGVHLAMRSTGPAETAAPRDAASPKARGATPRPTPEPAAADGMARLLVDFEHHLASGTIRVSVDGDEVWSSPLAARKKTKLSIPGWDGGPKVELSHEAITKELLVPAGVRRVLVSVSGSGVDDADSVRMDLGSERTSVLKVRVSRITKKLDLSVGP